MYSIESEVKVKLLSRVGLCDPVDCSLQASPSMGFSRQEYWSGVPFPSPEDLPNPVIDPGFPALQADALPSEPPGNYFKLFAIWFSQKITINSSSGQCALVL